MDKQHDRLWKTTSSLNKKLHFSKSVKPDLNSDLDMQTQINLYSLVEKDTILDPVI